MNNATPTLLYIDDDAGLARLVDRGLTRAGFKVVLAASGEQRGTGKAITGASNLVFLFIVLSGLVLWWPGRFTSAAGAVPSRLSWSTARPCRPR